MSGADGEAKRIEKEIGALRDEIGDLVGELDRRRREAFDLRLQARRHPMAVSLAGLTLAALLGGSVALIVRNVRRKRRRSYKVMQLERALGRAARFPDRVARGEASPAEKILTAVGTAAATILVKRALARALPRAETAARAPR